MLKEAIEKIIELSSAKNGLIEIEGLPYANDKFDPVIPPAPDKMRFSTLIGIVDFMDNARVDIKEAVEFVHVRSHDQVSVVSYPTKPWGKRNVLAEAVFENRHTGFPFGQYLEIDEFIIKARTHICMDDELARLIAEVSRVSGSVVATSEDDGCAQTVTVKDSVGRLAEKEFNPVIRLSPRRTFSEIKQPSSKYLLRFKKAGDRAAELPLVALFGFDDNKWKTDAVFLIKDFLSSLGLKNKTIG